MSLRERERERVTQQPIDKACNLFDIVVVVVGFLISTIDFLFFVLVVFHSCGC